jgi:hypothetical protein
MRPIGCPETLVTNYQSTLGEIPEERISHFLCTFPELETDPVDNFLQAGASPVYKKVMPILIF